jgi:dipeptidyl aminopeptidase/acylaminoacyl peptidase
MVHPDTYEIQAVSFVKERTEWVIFDQSIKEDFEKIKAVDHGDFFILSRDNEDQKWVIGFTRDNGPVPYYAYDRTTKKATFLFDNKPDLKQYELAPMEPVSFKTRDGLTVHGYITFPPGDQKKQLPMVLNVHGGPWSRDTWGYDGEAQWFANRGYICLQVNFRGSTGYGKEFLNASIKEWGGKMHDDLVDAVHWAIKKGYADPKRIAIYGGSYGGYAALVGATFTPDLFSCAVDIVGPSNLITMIKSIPPYWSTLLAIEHKRVGNPDTEEVFLKSRSPLFKVDQIKIPILIGQGANDPRVKQAESEQIVQAMKEKGIDHEYMLFPDEGHGFAKPENRIKFYAHAEKFLAKHLGGRFEK